jgi:hypothetical protein
VLCARDELLPLDWLVALFDVDPHVWHKYIVIFESLYFLKKSWS